MQQILSQPRLGRRPTLQVILDLTTLEKAGFKEFKDLIRVYNGKRGQHERNALPGSGAFEEYPEVSFVYRGKDTLSPVQLGLRLVRRLPKILTLSL